MAQVINTNSLSLMTRNNLNKSQYTLGSAIERLSSGLRISSAKDDAAGMAIANRFTANIRGLSQAARNANDGISVAQTTEGALSEINNNLQRVRELSVQAASGSNSDTDLVSIQAEITQRLDEINRVSAQTDFNGRKVLSQDGQMTFQVGAEDNQAITIDLQKTDTDTLKLSDLDVATAGNAPSATVTTVPDGTKANVTVGGTTPTLKDTSLGVGPVLQGVTFNYSFNMLLTKDSKGSYYVVYTNSNGNTTKGYAAIFDSTTGEYKYDSSGGTTTPSGSVVVVGGQGYNVAIDTKTLGKDTLVSYQDNGQTKYAVRDATTGDYYSADFATDPNNLSGVIAAKGTRLPSGQATPMQRVDDALSQVDKMRSNLGAVQNRFESVISNLGNAVDNLTAARSRIEDSDYATEVSNMSRAQILQQAGGSVLTQANQSMQNVLSLLRSP